MNLDQDEKKLRALFHDVRAEDERDAPSFAYDWQAAVDRLRPAGRLWPGKWVLVAACIVVVVYGSWFFFVRDTSHRAIDDSGPVAGVSPSAPQERAPGPSQAATVDISRLPSKKPSARTRHRSATAMEASALISQWRSPTDFLLKFPADRLLKSVPRLDDSIVDLDSAVPED